MKTETISALLTVREAAHFLNVSVSTLYGWAWQRRISFVKVGRALRFDRADLDKFIRANRFEARTESGKTIGPSVAYNTGAAGKG
jgi:excisionase family DNA binding protein